MASYKVDDMVRGKVTGIEDYGFFLSLKDGYTGLVHISEISKKFVKNVSDYVSIGEDVTARVISVDDTNKKLKLSIKDLTYDDLSKENNGFDILKDKLPLWIDEYHKTHKA